MYCTVYTLIMANIAQDNETLHMAGGGEFFLFLYFVLWELFALGIWVMHEMDVLLPANFNADSDIKNIQKVTLTNVTKGQK